MNMIDSRELEERPTKHRMMSKIAIEVSKRSTCNRLHVGAIITDPEMSTIWSIGYNGTARGLPNGCDRVTPGDCGCLHAEVNALMKAPYDRGELYLFTTHTPCVDCSKLIINSRVSHVFAFEEYRSPEGVYLLIKSGISVDRWDNEKFMFVNFTNGGEL